MELASFVLVLASVAACSSAVPQGGRRWWALATLLACAVIAGLLAGDGWVRTLLFDVAAFASVGLVWTTGTAAAARAARTYLTLVVISVASVTVALLILGSTTAVPTPPWDRIVVALVVVGFGIKLAAVPFYVWLPAVAEHAAPMTTVLIVAVLDVATFGELARLRVASPWVFEAWQPLWLALALLSMLGGALLALAERDLKRMLAFSTSDGMGYLLVGLLAGPGPGLAGALAGAMAHALSKTLLFGAVAVTEARLGRSLTLDDCGLAARCPVSAAAFVAGALGMIGVPPTLGFIGRWQIYLAGSEYGGQFVLLVMILATSLAVLYHARAIHRVWLGGGEPRTAAEPRLAVVALVTLIALLMVLGVFPVVLTGAGAGHVLPLP